MQCITLLSPGRCLRWQYRSLKIPRQRAAVRHNSSSSSPPKKRTWLRLTVVTLTAAGIGAYLRTRQDARNSDLDPTSFAHYRLVSRDPVSSTNSIFTLEPSRPANNQEIYELAWQTGIWSVMFKQPQLQIGRDYTPLPPLDGNSNGDEIKDSLRFLIRRDPHGEVSRYLHSLPLGADIEIRGPQIECEISPDVRDVLFIAGGTGIAPALQAIYIMLRRTASGGKPRIHILWANRKREDCLGGISDTPTGEPSKTSWWPFGRRAQASSAPASEPLPSSISQGAIVRELQELKARYPDQITVDYFVDEENSFISTKEITAFTDSVQPSTTAEKKMIIVSGPEGFINYMAGSKIWAQGYELQGSIGGIIKQLDLKDWKIWKL